MAPETIESRAGAVEVEALRAPSGERLRVRDLRGGAEICLDPIELEGLTRVRHGALAAALGLAGNGGAAGANGAAAHETEAPASVALEVLQNEFAMVAVGRVDVAGGPRLLVRDLASRTEVLLDPGELCTLTGLRHRSFAPMLDPSSLVQAVEPDPDQV
ncbi:MAG: hypothetical protein QOF29_611 [bacterium]|jgi:hypothetical protein|nr:hypothetical protein [Solirubrobacteraceae bacterium]